MGLQHNHYETHYLTQYSEINEFTPNTLVVLLVIDYIESTGLDGVLETLKHVFNTSRKHLNGAAPSPDVYLRDFTDMGTGASSNTNQTVSARSRAGFIPPPESLFR